MDAEARPLMGPDGVSDFAELLSFLAATREYLASTAPVYPENAYAATLVERVRRAAHEKLQREVAPWQ